MPYNPGITYDGDRYLAQGITSAADSIADTIKKYGEENELVKSYRSVAKNTPGFYDSMGISKEEMGGMGNKDVMALFKGYALKTAMQDQQQQRQFAINAEARSVAASQLAATQEERLKKASEGVTAYNAARSLEGISQGRRNDALVAAANSEEQKVTNYNKLLTEYLTANPEATTKERSDATLRFAYGSNLSPENMALISKMSTAYDKNEIQYREINGIMHFSNNGSVYKPVDDAHVQVVKDSEGNILGYRVGHTWVGVKDKPEENALDRFLKANSTGTPNKKPTGTPNKKPTGTPNPPSKNAPTSILVDEDGVEHIIEQPPTRKKGKNEKPWNVGE